MGGPVGVAGHRAAEANGSVARGSQLQRHVFLKRIAIGMVLGFAGMLGSSACGRPAEPATSEASAASVASTSAEAPDDVETLEQEGWFTYSVCVLLKGGPTTARAAFCASQPEDDVRARCRAHVFDSPVAWGNWCYNEFAE